MINIVLDTNILVSFLLAKGQNLTTLLIVWDNKTIQVFYSDEILSELKKVLNYPRIDKYLTHENKEWLIDKIRLVGQKVRVTKSLNINRDPKDNIILETAIAARARFIVSGDKDLLDMREYKGIKILNPKDFNYWLKEFNYM